MRTLPPRSNHSAPRRRWLLAFVAVLAFGAVALVTASSSLVATQTATDDASSDTASSGADSSATESASPGICDAGYNPYWSYQGEYAAVTATPPAELMRAPNTAVASCFAWQTFIALGHSPDGQELVNDGTEGPTTWETWQTVDEVFPPSGGVSCGLETGEAVVLTMDDGSSAEIEDHLDEDMECLDVLVRDREDRPVWREVQLDPKLVASLDKYETSDATSFQFEVGSMASKAAWKVYDEEQDADEGFYVRRHVLGGDQGCREEKVALVALHLVRKTERFPGWVWMTFEHRRNAPSRTDVSAGRTEPWTFYQSDSTCPVNEPCETEDDDGQGPTQVVRYYDLNEDVKQVNDDWHTHVPEDSVWRNYVLIGVQWSFGDEQEADGVARLSNVVLETGCQQVSCYHCHSSTYSVDRSFTLLHDHAVVEMEEKKITEDGAAEKSSSR